MTGTPQHFETPAAELARAPTAGKCRARSAGYDLGAGSELATRARSKRAVIAADRRLRSERPPALNGSARRGGERRRDERIDKERPGGPGEQEPPGRKAYWPTGGPARA